MRISCYHFTGRDTPSSQIMENENEEAGAMEQTVESAPPSKKKQPCFDLDDKFGKFEIKHVPRCKFIHLDST